MRELLVLVSCVFGLSAAVLVDTKYGAVRGMSHLLHDGKEVNSYLAVPFAKPPVDELRFEKPLEPESWDEELIADTLGPACMQGTGGLLWLTHPGWNSYSEDCLHMNIYTPQNMDAGPYAVMVWFHGGGYSGSANIQYPGYFLASKDVVVVVPNYRLGIFGFGSTGDDVAPGNYGLWDQNLALKFVQENIGNFGGDPNRVTIFGQSAGASSSGLHIVSPQSEGLFHQAIYHSGNEMTLWAVNYPEANPEDYIREVARKNACPDAESSEAIIECLRAIPAADLRANSGFDCAPGHFCQGHSPVVDGPGGFLPDTPQDLRAEGRFSKVPIMAGHCDKDGSPYTLSFIPEASDGGFTRAEFLFYLRTRLVEYFAPRLSSNRTIDDVYEAVKFYYTAWPDLEDLEENRQAFNDMVTDVGFGYTGDVVYKQQSEYADVYNFILAYRSAAAAALIPEWIGVPHNGELPYVWGFTLMQLNPEIRQHSGFVFDIIEWDQLDTVFAGYMQEMWANFAKFGDPTPSPVEAPDGSLTTWKKFSPNEMNYLHINSTMEDRVDYRQQNFAFWRDYMSYISGLQTVYAEPEIEMPSDVKRMPSDHMDRSFYQPLSKRVLDIVEEKYNVKL